MRSKNKLSQESGSIQEFLKDYEAETAFQEIEDSVGKAHTQETPNGELQMSTAGVQPFLS